MRVDEVMRRDVVPVAPDVPAGLARSALASQGVVVAPVVDTGLRVIGLVTAADLGRTWVVPEGWIVEDLPEPRVVDVMCRRPAVASASDDIAAVTALLRRTAVPAVPVVAADGRLAGLVTRDDLQRLDAG